MSANETSGDKPRHNPDPVVVDEQVEAVTGALMRELYPEDEGSLITEWGEMDYLDEVEQVRGLARAAITALLPIGGQGPVEIERRSTPGLSEKAMEEDRVCRAISHAAEDVTGELLPGELIVAMAKAAIGTQQDAFQSVQFGDRWVEVPHHNRSC